MDELLSVGRAAQVAGVTIRTLHHYDDIGLVRPSARSAAGYRAYAASDVQRLRDVLAYRAVGLGLQEIADLLDDPKADVLARLHRLRGMLLEQRDRADLTVAAIDHELDARARGLRVTPTMQLALVGARLYEEIGGHYTATRRTDPRIAAQLWSALGDAKTVLNVGAGTGSYEPPDREVTAVEPSALMRAQRPPGSAPCVAAAAENLPFEDQSFDAAMAFSTVPHWSDPVAGLREMRRVARRVVVFTYDSSEFAWRRRFWLTRDYLPEAANLDPGWSVDRLADAIGAHPEPVLIPWDCTDGFLEAFWRRPEAYLEEHARRACSVWTRLGADAEERAVEALRDDLDSGRWAERNQDLADLDAAELGLRLLVA